jgi:hypothetical protein
VSKGHREQKFLKIYQFPARESIALNPVTAKGCVGVGKTAAT